MRCMAMGVRFLLLWGLISFSYSQIVRLSARVVDSLGNGITYVLVKCGDKYVYSDEKGYFSINCYVSDSISFVHINYTELRVRVSDIIERDRIKLSYRVVPLDEVLITDSINLVEVGYYKKCRRTYSYYICRDGSLNGVCIYFPDGNLFLIRRIKIRGLLINNCPVELKIFLLPIDSLYNIRNDTLYCCYKLLYSNYNGDLLIDVPERIILPYIGVFVGVVVRMDETLCCSLDRKNSNFSLYIGELKRRYRRNLHFPVWYHGYEGSIKGYSKSEQVLCIGLDVIRLN